MDLKEIEIMKDDERGVLYQCGEARFIFRKKGSMSANHTHADPETLWLVEGEIEMTVGDEVKILKAPIGIDIEPNTYHKVMALTDIRMVLDREGKTN